MLRSFGSLYTVDTLADIQPGALLPTATKNYFICLEDNSIYEVVDAKTIKTSDFDFLFQESEKASDSDKLVVVEGKFLKRIEILEKRSAFLLSLISDKIIPPELFGGDE